MTPGTGPGRPVAVAVDIGGTKLSAGVVTASGAVQRYRQVAVEPVSAAQEPLFAAVSRLVVEVAGDDAVTLPLGVACAGPVDLAQGLVSPINLPGWRDFPLRERLRARFPSRPVTVLGDGAAAALGEFGHGAGRGARSLLGLVVSTGVGGGLVLDGRLQLGASGNAGHVGHLSLPMDLAQAEPCGCAEGVVGCVETLSCGPAVLVWARTRGWDGGGLADLGRAARAGNPVAAGAFDRAGFALAHAISQTSLVCDLDVATLGGGVSRVGDVLLQPVRRHLGLRPAMAFARRVEVRLGALGPAAGLIGAALQASAELPAR